MAMTGPQRAEQQSRGSGAGPFERLLTAHLAPRSAGRDPRGWQAAQPAAPGHRPDDWWYPAGHVIARGHGHRSVSSFLFRLPLPGEWRMRDLHLGTGEHTAKNTTVSVRVDCCPTLRRHRPCLPSTGRRTDANGGAPAISLTVVARCRRSLFRVLRCGRSSTAHAFTHSTPETSAAQPHDQVGHGRPGLPNRVTASCVQAARVSPLAGAIRFAHQVPAACPSRRYWYDGARGRM